MPRLASGGWALARRWGPPAVTLIMVALLLVYFQQTRLLDSIDLAHMQWGYVALLGLIRFGFLLALGLAMQSYLATRQLRLDFTEWFGLTVAASLVNTLTPIGGGALVRGGYLKIRYRFPSANFMAFLAFTSALNLLVNGVFGLILMIGILPARPGPASWILIAIFATLVVGPTLGLSLPLEKLRLPGGSRIVRWAHLALEGWREIRANPRLLLEQAAIAIAYTLTQMAGLHVGLLALGAQPRLIDSLIIAIVISAWRVTPSVGFGVQEIVGALVASAIGVNPAAGMGSVFLTRIVTILYLSTFGVAYTYMLSKRLGQPLANAARAVTLVSENDQAEPLSPPADV